MNSSFSCCACALFSRFSNRIRLSAMARTALNPRMTTAREIVLIEPPPTWL
jgi:hypothetical protein